jgi:hypothetical protein
VRLRGRRVYRSADPASRRNLRKRREIMRVLRAIGLLASVFAGVCAAAMVKGTGLTVEMGGVEYFLPPGSVGRIEVEELKTSFRGQPFVPITVVDETTYSAQDLEAVASKYLAEDDVFQTEFLEGTFVRNMIKTMLVKWALDNTWGQLFRTRGHAALCYFG